MHNITLSLRLRAAFPAFNGMALVAFAGCFFLPSMALAQQAHASIGSMKSPCSTTNVQGAIALHAPVSHSSLALCDGHALAIGSRGAVHGTPLALASSDFDEDGVQDLVSGFATSSGGTVTVHRGNVAALWPYGPAAQGGTPSAFLPDAHSFSIPEAPDFLAAGDFDGDGHVDIVAAKRGSNALYLLKGDGHGSFALPKKFELAGGVTDLIAGEVNQADGLMDLVVGVTGPNGSAALVYQSPIGALKAPPESFPLSQPATALALGKFSGSTIRDLAIGAGSQLTLVHGRDRKLSSGSTTGPVGQAVVTKQTLGFGIRALVSGDFTGGAPSIAALGNDGNVHVLEHAVTSGVVANLADDSSAQPTMQTSGHGSTAFGGSTTPNKKARVAALRQLATNSPVSSEWIERSSVSLPNGFDQTTPRLIAARVSGSTQEDVLAVDRANSQIHVLSTMASQKQLKAEAVKSGAAVSSAPQMSMLASLSASGAPAAVLPMRLNQHGLSGLVALQSDLSSPVLMPQDIPATSVFVVTNTLDITDASQKDSPPAGSLRAAMEAAQSASGDNGGGTYSIVFNIPTSDPGYNSTTGVYTIRPFSENVPNSLDNFALPPINATLTIDGYTQPGASPNTLPNGDNAKIVIQIDGSAASTPGGAGLVPFDDVGTVIRGLAFTGWTNPAFSNGTASGAEGIEANGVGDFIEGNFFGTVDGKTPAPNRIGIFADNGPLFGSAPGNIIGGTTPQARNILSGNTVYGIAFLSTAYEGQLQGNFIGLDSTGAATMGNGSDGVGMNGPTVSIGGTLAGTRNVIAGNVTNVDINDLTNGNAATGSYVQGNYIGTDATGTVGLSPNGVGVSIVHNPTNYLIGGTTAAARNVISGNSYGVYIFDNSFNNLVQGNYIGTDASGATAVPNLLQGFITGQTTSSTVSAGNTTIGGAIAGAGNVISGNGSDGVQINGTSGGSYSPYVGNTVQGNFIGTDATGTKSLPNQGNGVSILAGGTNNVIGGANSGLGNLIANNALNGVLIDPGTANGPGTGNTTVANIISSNGGAGVRVASGTGNRISANSIFSNSALGIDIDAAGPGTNTHCNASNSGANKLQNYPVLTAGTGSSYITATATDPAGNTSEFSAGVAANGVAPLLNLLGSFDSVANTAFTLEFFSNPAATSGSVQGQTYLGSTTITTGADCTSSIQDNINLTQADVSVTLSTSASAFQVGPDFGLTTYNAAVTNNGPATAHSVTFTDTLPAQLQISSTYCNVGACQSPIITSQGTCTVNGKIITCNLGVMAPGGAASIVIPVQAIAIGDFTNTVNVMATETDPNYLNNTASKSSNSSYPYPFIDHVDPATALLNSSAIAMNVYGVGFTSATTVTFNGTSLPVRSVIDNQVCGGPFSSEFCTALQVSVPASLLTAPGTFTVEATNPSVEPSDANFTVVSACTYNVFSAIDSELSSEGTNLIADSASVTTNVSSCPWTATSTVPWAAILDNASFTGSGTVDIAIAPNTDTNPRSGSITVAGQIYNFTQDAGSSDNCSVALDPATAPFSASGGAGTINATLSNSSCAPFAEAYPESGWITITSKSNLLVASGPLNYAVAPNNGPARTGGIAIGGNVTVITQAAPNCYFTLSSASALVSAAGGTGSVTVTPTPSSCSWTATSSNTSQVNVTSGGSGTGNGTVNYTVAANPGGPIQPTITIGNSDSTSAFTINQASANTCTFTVSPSPKSVTSNGTSNFFTVRASFNFCKWTATSNNPDSLAITEHSSGTGTGVVYYSVAQNAGAARTLTITAGCQTFTVNQDSTNVTNPTPVLTSLQPSSTTAGSGAFTLTVNGTGFVSGATVNFNGNVRTTTFVSSTQVTAAILASDVMNTAVVPVTVTNPTPGGGTSDSLNFTIGEVSNNPVPVITMLQPSSATAGSGAFNLTVTGTGFVSGATVSFNGSPRTTAFVSATQLTAAILAGDVANSGTVPVVVTNPAPGGGTSNSLTFTINAAPTNPVPVITSLQPSSATAGSGAFALVVNGTGFVSGATVNFNGSARSTNFVSATQVTAMILASDLTNAGTPTVTVTNPAPGGGTSNSLTFTINAAPTNPVPVITSLQPASTTAGSGAFTLTVTGTGFVSGATVNFNGTARVTTFVSATQVTAAILAGDISNAGTVPVTVTNPVPGGGTSNALQFVINAVVVTNPAPTITTLQPASVTAGSGAQTLTVNGTNFISSSTVNFNGSSRVTTFVSATKLTAALLATDVASAATSSVTVTNPTPGGGTSGPATFTVTPASTTGSSYALSSTTAAQTIQPGGSAQYSITVSALNGTYSNPVTLSATGLPNGATATFAPASVTPGSTSATSTLTIQAPLTMSQLSRRGASWPVLASVFPLAGLFFMKKSRRRRLLMLALVTVFCVGGLVGCGGGFSYFGSNPQSYNVTVTGTNGTTQQSTTIKLTVNF